MKKRRSSVRPLSVGFTLTELLVVIGILALLTAILLPVFASARRKAQQSACVSNLRQLHMAFSLYAQENDGLLPPYPSRPTALIGTAESCVEESARLLSVLGPYVHSAGVWRCPGDTSRPDPAEISCGLPVPDLTSYTYRGFHLIRQGIEPVRLDNDGLRFSSSAHTLLEDSYSCPGDASYARYNHGGRWNIIFLDGHARSFGLDCTNAEYITETP